jgi:hypothetical protein
MGGKSTVINCRRHRPRPHIIRVLARPADQDRMAVGVREQDCHDRVRAPWVEHCIGPEAQDEQTGEDPEGLDA